MDKTNFAQSILEAYKNGKRYFTELDLMCENFDDQCLQDIVFEKCFLYSSFRRANLRNAKFINGNIKTCDFREADLTNAHFENVAIEGAQFARSITDGIYFDKNWAYGGEVTQADFEDWVKDSE